MSLPASRSTAIFRACVVNAVKESEALMEQLIRTTRADLTETEQKASGIQERMHLGDALRALDQQEATLLKSYPMALLETFSDGGGSANKSRAALDTGMDFGELTLVDDNEVMAQVELARAQQIASHATDAALAELNTLVSSAQGFSNVQPERNPFRPENYIRALQRAVDDCQVSSETRQLWIERMREVLGPELTAAYKRVSESLREHGVTPVGYMVASVPGTQRNSNGGSQAGMAQGGGTAGYGYTQSNFAPPTHAGLHGGWNATGLAPIAPMGYGQPMIATPTDPQEAILAAGILRQMLAAGGDPFAYDAVQPMQQRVMPVAQQVVMNSGHAAPVNYSNAQASEAMEDIAQLEKLVGRLSGNLGVAQPVPGVPMMRAGEVPVVPATNWQQDVSVPGNLSAYGSLSARTATEVLSRMMDHIAQDSRLLAPVQRAVQNLEPALKRLVRHDASFFSNEQHPARRLLDDLTQRSLTFTDPDSKGFRKYIQLVNAAVQHLATMSVHDASAFEHVSGALESAWNTQVQQLRRQQDNEQKALAETEKRQMLTARLAKDFHQLPEARNVPPDILEFITGVWAGVVAKAQCDAVQHGIQPGGDPHGYLAVVPQILWCAQPSYNPEDAQRILPLLTPMQFTVRDGLRSVGQPDQNIALVLQRLAGLQNKVAESAAEFQRSTRVDVQIDVPVEPEAAAPAPVPVSVARVPEPAPQHVGSVARVEKVEKRLSRTLTETPAQTFFAEPAPAPAPVAMPVSQALQETEPVSVSAPETLAPSEVAVPPPLDISASVPLEAPAGVSEETGRSGNGTEFEVGQWVELTTNQRTVKTQLTWVSPHNTLFLFTALDASTQSMTRRMLDKLNAEGMIRKLEDQRVVARALGAVAADAKDSKLRSSKKAA
ncbi:DUF1631 domain-containing protein [Diaphorobacter sp. HDW4A]|uniref:DUF1631 family protein n=1 Tax=Diaphorobacter sp. HDW4A TaxID=2714924 RepID=UPI001409080E|nr:DUF1631 family protein [Diaphorobacter sp. HDW4A]QIL79306.1 DUF1631 domain-containing protein [Diaphorobacter sp. HDW4A]